MSRGSSTLDAVQMDLFEGRGPAGDARSGKDRRAATVPEPRPGSWPAFTRALAETLAVLEDTQYLILDRKPAGIYVQVTAENAGLRIEAISNHYLEGVERCPRDFAERGSGGCGRSGGSRPRTFPTRPSRSAGAARARRTTTAT